jgi:hypothetical protein
MKSKSTVEPIQRRDAIHGVNPTTGNWRASSDIEAGAERSRRTNLAQFRSFVQGLKESKTIELGDAIRGFDPTTRS